MYQNKTPFSDRDFTAVLLLWIFLGSIGVHDFYAGNTSKGVTKILLTVFSFLVIPAIVLTVFLIIDLVHIVQMQYTDGLGRPIVSEGRKFMYQQAHAHDHENETTEEI
jgi:TM2 domain-containing membrane protein YozV